MLAGVVEQLQKPEDYSSATTTANGTPCTVHSQVADSGICWDKVTKELSPLVVGTYQNGSTNNRWDLYKWIE